MHLQHQRVPAFAQAWNKSVLNKVICAACWLSLHVDHQSCITLSPCRWKGTAALLHSLMASLDVNTEPAPPATPEPTPGQPLTPSHLPSASVATQPAALRTPTNSLQSRRGVHRTPRLALLVLATLLQQNQYGLLLYMVKQDQGDAERGCLCQSLLEMVDAVTRGGSGWCFYLLVARTVTLLQEFALWAALVHGQAGPWHV